jgi:hypothetical protein
VLALPLVLMVSTHSRVCLGDAGAGPKESVEQGMLGGTLLHMVDKRPMKHHWIHGEHTRPIAVHARHTWTAASLCDSIPMMLLRHGATW